MTNTDALVGRVKERARSGSAALPPPVGEAELEAAESALGFRLPPLLADLYRRIANGGFGPEYHFLPLVGEGETAVAAYLDQRAETDEPCWPEGVLPILEWGCAMYAAVDCTSESSTVLLFEPNAFDGDWAEVWFVDAENLAGWLETWMAGTGWYEPDGGEEIELSLWAAARARLEPAAENR
ncbi:hypothetical protein BJF79_36880 [Actinomadura sp. CNU-125]|uniref:SMI1/KNR4 family protein n=1 Tax=Actinomadura sp. CNU-125 TaxID=1904961 RepID=UPI0009663C9B|nr:SMI1/KNR4 family protein [Actinomadura sp. CNU-125]OLT31538.1 hypothetical protein BJF79_36880 [Actinomadura sp. CNU-125]